MPSVRVEPVKVGTHITPHLLARLSKPQSEAYLGSVTGRRGTRQKTPYPSSTRTRRRAAQDEYQALGDAGSSIFCVDAVEMEIRDDDYVPGSIANTPKTCEKRRNENLAEIVVGPVSRNSRIPA